MPQNNKLIIRAESMRKMSKIFSILNNIFFFKFMYIFLYSLLCQRIRVAMMPLLFLANVIYNNT